MKATKILTALLALLSLSGCMGIAKSVIAGPPDEEDLKEYWFTYAGEQPFADTAQGLVVGSIRLKEGGPETQRGCTFQVERQGEAGWTAVDHVLEYRVSHDRGPLLGTSWDPQRMTTRDVWAGTAPPARREALAPVFGVGAAGAALFMGDQSWVTNLYALQSWLPPGAFMLRLPPGRYRLAKVEFFAVEGDSAQQGQVVTNTTRTWSDSREIGPEFTVKAGVVGFIGAHDYGAVPERHSHDPAAGRAILQAAIRRLPAPGTPWPLEVAGQGTPGG